MIAVMQFKIAFHPSYLTKVSNEEAKTKDYTGSYTQPSHFGTGRQPSSVDKPYIIVRESERDVKSE